MRATVQGGAPFSRYRSLLLSLLTLLFTALLLLQFTASPATPHGAATARALPAPSLSVLGQALWPAALAVFTISLLLSYWQQTRRRRSVVSVWKVLVQGLLPIFLIGLSYLGLAVLGHLDLMQTILFLGVGFSVAYFNLGATLLAGTRPLDGGYVWRDGYRLLGDGKSLRGSCGGILIATLIHLSITGALAPGLLIGTTAMLGDLLASFLKRRSGIASGATVPVLDQIDGVLLFLVVENQLGVVGLQPPAPALLVVAALVVQFTGNGILYLLGHKRVPW